MPEIYLLAARNYITLHSMKPTHEDIQPMVQALFTLIGSLDRARRSSPGTSALAVLQYLAQRECRPLRL